MTTALQKSGHRLQELAHRLQGWATGNYRVGSAYWLNCQILKGTHAPHSEGYLLCAQLACPLA